MSALIDRCAYCRVTPVGRNTLKCADCEGLDERPKQRRTPQARAKRSRTREIREVMAKLTSVMLAEREAYEARAGD